MDIERIDNEYEVNNAKPSRKGLLYAIIAVAAVVVIAVVLIIGMKSNEVVARVGDQKITKEELYNQLVEYYGKNVLESMIADKIVAMEIEKQNITVTDEELQEKLDEFVESYGGEEYVSMMLSMQGMTMDDLREDMLSYLKRLKLIEPRIEVTDEEISEYFEENKANFDQPEQVEASHILVDDEETAKEIKKKLDEGADFAELAAEYSKDTGSAENGGQLGYFGRGKMVEEFENAAFSMEVGQISDPVKTKYGYHIIKVTGKKEAKEATLEDARDEIVEILKEQKLSSEYSEWLEEKKAEYNVYNSLSQTN
mgnify:CR=1 FL=1|jgi:PPIC-type PPIASE domain./Bacterial trigger factor protein (TF) C-terminus.